jgi:hypothetical protein
MTPGPLREWVLSGLILAAVFTFAVTACASGMFLVLTFAFGGVGELNPRSLNAAAAVLISGLLVFSLTVTLAVAIVFEVRGPSLWRVLRRHRPRSRLRTLMVAVAAFAGFVALFIYAGRAFHANRTARSQAESAAVYRWLQGLDSELPGILIPRNPSDIWSPMQLQHLRAMERYHQGLSQKYYNATYRPWLAMPPDPPEPQEPEQSAPLRAFWKAFARQFRHP